MFFLYRTIGATNESKIFTELSLKHSEATEIFVGFIMQYSEHRKYDIPHLGYSRIHFYRIPHRVFVPGTFYTATSTTVCLLVKM